MSIPIRLVTYLWFNDPRNHERNGQKRERANDRVGDPPRRRGYRAISPPAAIAEKQTRNVRSTHQHITTVSPLRNALQGCRRALAIWRQPDPRCRPLRTPERRSRVASSVARTRSLTGRVVLAEIHRHPSTVQRAIRTGQRSTKAKRTTTGGASKCGTERRGVHCATAAGAEGVPPKRG